MNTPRQVHGAHTINSKSLVKQAIRGEACPRFPVGPLAVHSCAQPFGATIQEYTLNPKTLADSVIHYYETFGPDAVWISADTWVSAEAMGAKVGFTDPNHPMGGTGGTTIQNRADIDRIPAPDVNRQGRYPLMLEAVARVVEAIGKDVFIVTCFDQYPFSLACALLGVEQAMHKIYEDREMLDATMERCLEYAAAYAEALADAGADLLSGGDSPAGLLGPRLYAEVAQPFECKLIDELHQRTDRPVSLHICGNSTFILEAMAATGAEVLELDHHVDFEKAIEIASPDVAIWGNLDPVGLLIQQGKEEVKKAAKDLIDIATEAKYRRFILSSGCTLAVETPVENLHALIQASKQYGSSSLQSLHTNQTIANQTIANQKPTI